MSLLINKIFDKVCIGIIVFVWSLCVLTYIGLFMLIGKVIYDVIIWAI